MIRAPGRSSILMIGVSHVRSLKLKYACCMKSAARTRIFSKWKSLQGFLCFGQSLIWHTLLQYVLALQPLHLSVAGLLQVEHVVGGSEAIAESESVMMTVGGSCICLALRVFYSVLKAGVLQLRLTQWGRRGEVKVKTKVSKHISLKSKVTVSCLISCLRGFRVSRK